MLTTSTVQPGRENTSSNPTRSTAVGNAVRYKT